jgi:hypothetical protein
VTATDNPLPSANQSTLRSKTVVADSHTNHSFEAVHLVNLALFAEVLYCPFGFDRVPIDPIHSGLLVREARATRLLCVLVKLKLF